MMKDLKKILHNQNGVAIMLVLTSIVILTALMVQFTYDVRLNKIKEENIEDRGRAKLIAEAGLRFAMTRLHMYMGAYNFVEKNENVKNMVGQNSINTIWNFPFVYPIPPAFAKSSKQKLAIEKFMKTSILNGQMSLSIQNISNQINLNLIRVSLLADYEYEQMAASDPNKTRNQTEARDFSPESQLLQFLDRKIQEKIYADESFAAEFSGVDLRLLVNAIKFYLSDPQSFDDKNAVSGYFQDIKITPKNAPFSSFSELYLIPGWKDGLVDLIKNDFNAHQNMMIDLNTLTADMLKLLIPNLAEQDIKDFFKYRDGGEVPHPMNSLEDFKQYFTQVARVIESSDFDNKFTLLEKYGLKFGPTPTLFKVIVSGTYERANYNINAIVSLPKKPIPLTNTNANPPPNRDENKEEENKDENDENDEPDPTPATPNTQTTPPELLTPRIIEIQI